MPLFADTDTLIIALVNIIVGAILTAFLAWIKRGQTSATNAAVASAKTAADTAEQVKTDLKIHTNSQNEKMDSLAEGQNTIHTLVNSAMGNQLKINMMGAQELAKANPTAENVGKADIARKAYEAHQAKQAEVDATAEEKA